jgi:hypothetical protein
MRKVAIALVASAAVAGAIACRAGDATAPEADTVLEAVMPSAGASDVDVAGVVTVRFSEAMATGMLDYLDLHAGGIRGPVVPTTCGLSADRRVMTCTPNRPLRPGSAYTIHLGSGMMDGDGRPVETESHGMALGGRPITGQMMDDRHGEQPMSMMGPGWRHSGDGHLGMAFGFETRSI